MTLAASREDLTRIRDDLGLFAELIGWPRTPWQLDALKLEKRQTVLISPRQCGKSQSLAVLAVWWAFRRPRQVVLVVSAGDEAAMRLLRTMREVTQHPLLSGSVIDETQSRVILSNGSEIRSVPASERQVRGWSVDLLLVDESAFVDGDLLMSAAMPTTAARKEARIVLASTPWADSGPFWKFAVDGEDPAHPFIRTFRWKLADAWWIAPEAIESARATMSPLRFRCEYEGEFAGASDAYFSQEDILAAVADFPMRHDGAGMPATAGLDWGRRADAHAIALAGLLDDCGVNGRPVVVVPWAETSRRPWAAQAAEVSDLAEHWDLQIYSETVGVGQAPTETVAQSMPRTRVQGVSTSQALKEDCYGRIAVLLAERALVLPDHPELLRQLGGVSAKPTPLGRLRIGARTESLHDDLPDALSLAVGGLPRQLATPPSRSFPDGQQWAETPSGVQIPVPVMTCRADVSWFSANADLIGCRNCANAYLAAHAACPRCGTKRPEIARTAKPAAISATPSVWGVIRCPACEHPYYADRHDACPRCSGGRAAGRGNGAQRALARLPFLR